MKSAKGSRKPSDLLRAARSSMTAKRVYGKPVRSNGVTVIPAARVVGGGGGGSNGESIDTAPGEGAGFGVMARPVGAFVIKDGVVSWKPAIDLLPLAGIALLLLLVLRSILRMLNEP